MWIRKQVTNKACTLKCYLYLWRVTIHPGICPISCDSILPMLRSQLQGGSGEIGTIKLPTQSIPSYSYASGPGESKTIATTSLPVARAHSHYMRKEYLSLSPLLSISYFGQFFGLVWQIRFSLGDSFLSTRHGVIRTKLKMNSNLLQLQGKLACLT